MCLLATSIAGAGQPAPDAPDAPPGPAAAMGAFNEVSRWIDGWEPPSTAPEVIPEVAGCEVQIRAGGRLLGRSWDHVEARRSREGGAHVSPVWRAGVNAMKRANGSVGFANDALRGERVRRFAERMILSTEVAGRLIPVEAETSAELELRLNPGIDGVAVRLLGQTELMFPSEMLSTNTLPHEAVLVLAARAGGNAKFGLLEPGELSRRHGARFFRFRTTHVAQATPGSSARVMVRGVPPGSEEAGLDSIRAAAAGVVEHLKQRHDPADPESPLAKTYSPWVDRYSDPAPLGSRLLAALALHRHHRDRGIPLDDRVSMLIREPLASALEVAQVTPSAIEPDALALLSVLASEPGLRITWPDVLDRRLVALVDESGGFAREVPTSARGLVVLGLAARVGRQGPEAQDEAFRLAHDAMGRAFVGAGRGNVVGQMPWLGWAAQRLAGDGPIGPSVGLRDMRSLVWEHQIEVRDVATEDVDSLGAIVFTASSRAGVPSWHSARAVAFLASMLSDGRLTRDEEVGRELVRLSRAAAFLHRLQAQETMLWMYPNDRRATGGVRASVWDQRMPLDASSMSLLAFDALLGSVESLSADAGESDR